MTNRINPSLKVHAAEARSLMATSASYNGSDRMPENSKAVVPQNQPVESSLRLVNQPKKARTLRFQLLQGLLPAVLIPLAIAGVIEERVIHRNFAEQVRTEAVLTSALTREYLDELTEITQIVADNPLVIEAVKSASQESQELNDLPVAEVEQKFTETKLIKPNQVLNNYLARSAETGGLSELYLTEQRGFNVAYNSPTDDFVQSDEDWWKNAKSNNLWISETILDEAAGIVSLDISQAIQDPVSGNFLGVVKAAVAVNSERLQYIPGMLEAAGIKNSQQVQLLDTKTGTVLETITAEGLSQQLEVVGGDVVRNIAATFNTDLANQVDVADIESKLMSQYDVNQLQIIQLTSRIGEPTVVLSFGYEQREYYLSNIDDTSFLAISSIAKSELASAGKPLILTFVILLLAASAVSVTVILRLSTQLSSPLRYLSSTAEEVAAGNLNIEAIPYGPRETQTLANTFNSLVTRLKGLLQAQTRATEEAEFLKNFTFEITQASTPEEVLDQLPLESVRNALQVDRVLIYQIDEAGSGTITHEAVANQWPRALGAEIYDPCFAREYLEKYQNGRVQATPDIYKADLTECHLNQLEPFAVKANLVTPIKQNEKLLGLLVAHQCSGPRDWQDSEIYFFSQIATQIGVAIDRSNLLVQREQAAEQARLIAHEQRQQKEKLQMQLVNLLGEVEGAASGDLTTRADVTADEIGTVADFFNSIIESLRQIVIQVKASAQQVNLSVGENELAIRQLADEALGQAEDITRALSSVELMTQSIQSVAESARQAAEVARHASVTAESGSAAMERTEENILMLRETVGTTAKQVKRLGESSQQISKVVSLINQIAVQTNLLAINAGIEAARAGEEGQGFAVVAEEVGELANRSAAATQEIEKIVDTIQRETAQVVDAMEQSTTQVVEGTRLVEDTKLSLDQILDVSRQIDQLVQSISQATVSQVDTSTSVSQLMKLIAEVSNQTSSSSLQVSDALRSTVDVAQELQASVDTFKVNAEG